VLVEAVVGGVGSSASTSCGERIDWMRSWEEMIAVFGGFWRENPVCSGGCVGGFGREQAGD